MKSPPKKENKIKYPTDHTQPARGHSSLQTGDQITMLYLAWLVSLSCFEY